MSTNSTVTIPASAPETKPAVQPQAVRRRRTSKTSGSVLDQAVGLRDQLRTTLTSTKELIRALKVEKRSQKSLKLAWDSLKQLQAAA